MTPERKYRLASHGLTITECCDIDSLWSSLRNGTPVKFRIKDGHKNAWFTGRVTSLSRHNTLNEEIDFNDQSEEQVLLFGTIETVEEEGKFDTEKRDFEYLNPRKQKGETIGELLPAGSTAHMRKKK